MQPIDKLLPQDYAERVYAGVLGKAIGVYLGRPFEGWPYEMIQQRLGDIEYYVHDQVGVPLLVTDDDIAGTFIFPRAFVDNGYDTELNSAQIGNSWLNYLIEHRTVFWWGGLGNSTEHTAYLRLKSGVTAPESGSAALNSQIVAEQIGAQIFIDGWAMLFPGDADRAAQIAERAARVSHDGEAVYGAVVLAVMEAMAFVESDTQRLIDTALAYIPADSTIRRLIDDVRTWHGAESDWRANRERLAAHYGYDKFVGNCHMVPNHGLIMLSLLHGEDDFSTTMKIVNTSGWDTDCNSGNVGCLMGIKNGLAGIDASVPQGRDWRTPVADKLYISSADPSWGITDCVRESQELVNTALALRGETSWQPKQGAQFHFDLPGSLQGFTVCSGAATVANVPCEEGDGNFALQIKPTGQARVGTPVFIPADIVEWSEQPRNPYPMMASPRVYPGQTVAAKLVAGAGAQACIYVCFYDADDQQQIVRSAETVVDGAATIQFTIPVQAYPVYEIGVEVDGEVCLDAMTWHGEPAFSCTRVGLGKRKAAMARRAWVNGVDEFVDWPWVRGYRLVQNRGRGLLIQGNRDWHDVSVTADMKTDMAHTAGVAVRVQGMQRFYALQLHRDGVVRIVKVVGEETVLASAPFAWEHAVKYELQLTVTGEQLVAMIDGREVLSAQDAEISCGGIALVLEDGCTVTETVTVAPAGGLEEKYGP